MVLASEHTWGDKVENGFAAIFGFIPELIAALLILVIGYFVAKIVAGAIARLLRRAGVDRTLTQGQGGRFVSRLTSSPAFLIGRIAFWALFLGVISLAVSVLGINALTNFVGAIFEYLPNILAALLIFLVAGAIAGGIAALVARTMGDTPTGKVIGSVAPVIVMAIATFMILDQLKIAEDIVEITYMALMGGLALALALAFGLGGRDVAARMLEGAYQAGQASRDQVRRDVQQGKQQAQEDIGRARGAAQERVESGSGGGGGRGASTPKPVGGATGGAARPSAPARPAGGSSTAATEIRHDRTEDIEDLERIDDVERVDPDEIDSAPPGSADPTTRR
jgi:small-conductance mechanosensitive channel